MRRLAIFWLACAVVGFLAAVGVACALSLALDGPASWRGAPAQRQPPNQETAPTNTSGLPAIVAGR